jgi:D-sedoheptulose 7-phosphate isomerase
MDFIEAYLTEAGAILRDLEVEHIQHMVEILVETRARGGRLFILGVGGSAANASHAVNDFRKITHIEAYAPTDNVSELTARTNDDGWSSVFEAWLQGSRFNQDDTLLVFSVGGGDLEKQVSANLVRAMQLAQKIGAKIIGVVGRSEGFAAQSADACVVIPGVNPEHVTPHTEAFQSIVWHLLVTHPDLKAAETKWESIK